MVLVERMECYRVPLKTVVQQSKACIFLNVSARDCFSFLPCFTVAVALQYFQAKTTSKHIFCSQI